MKIKNILLVDKDPTVGEALALCLAEKGVKLYFASNLQAALEILFRHVHELDLVVTDVEPRGHALELLAAIRGFRGVRLPMIVLGSLFDLGTNAVALSHEDCKVMRMPVDLMSLWTSVACLDGTEPIFRPQTETEWQTQAAAVA